MKKSEISEHAKALSKEAIKGRKKKISKKLAKEMMAYARSKRDPKKMKQRAIEMTKQRMSAHLLVKSKAQETK